MRLTTRQVAEKLNVRPSTVARMAKDGTLNDLNKDKNGRHAFAFDSAEINEIAKARKGGQRVDGSFASVIPALTAPVRVLQALDRIEQKVDALIKMWQ